MSLPLDACNWDENRLVAEITVRLPKGWGFVVDQGDNNFWVVKLLNALKEVVWAEADSTAQLALLTTVGWLDLQTSKRQNSGPWTPREKEDSPSRAHEEVYRKLRVEEDPPDLDPKEIAAVVASVYSRTRR
jgi:hypothetical protein